MADLASTLRDKLTHELVRAQTVTARRTIANMPQLRVTSAANVPTAARAVNISSKFMIGVSAIDSADQIG